MDGTNVAWMGGTLQTATTSAFETMNTFLCSMYAQADPFGRLWESYGPGSYAYDAPVAWDAPRVEVEVLVLEQESPSAHPARTSEVEAFLCLLVLSASFISTVAICCVRPTRVTVAQTKTPPLQAVKVAPAPA